jgi:hypothetical protein
LPRHTESKAELYTPIRSTRGIPKKSKDTSFPTDTLELKLSCFNAKERFALIQRVLGTPLTPHADFVREILQTCAIDASAEKVFCVMNFHLDWLYAALMCSELCEDEPTPLLANETGVSPVTGRQQDADFVIVLHGAPRQRTVHQPFVAG